MATINKFALALTTLTILTLTVPASAQMEESEGECCCDGTLNGKTWTYGNWAEVGLWGQAGTQIISLPNDFKKLTVSGTFITGMYGWGTNEGEGVAGITLKLGGFQTRATTNDGREVGETLGVATPGAFIGWYLGERLVLTTGAGVPLSTAGPGLEVDLKASILVLDWLAVDFGVPAGLYRTGVELDGKSVNTLAIGFGAGARVEFYGEYGLF